MAGEWTQAMKGSHLLWLPIPAYAGLPILIWIMHAKVWTFVVAIGTLLVLSYLKTKGRTVPWVIRRFRCYLRGGILHARTLWTLRRSRFLDSFDLVNLQG